MMTKFKEDFNRFWEMINDGNNFSLARYADGEVLLMTNAGVRSQTQAFMVDKWMATSGITKVGTDLMATLNHTESDYYYAISAKNDHMGDYTFLYNTIAQDKKNITFVNLWINANYNQMKDNLCSLKRDVILICNQKGRVNNYPFKVSDLIPFPDDCVNFWESNGYEYTEYLKDKFKSITNQLVFISCGPISEIIIHELYLLNNKNSYIDVGSSIDEYTHGYKTRPYMINGSYYNKLISEF
jgi:hypothetical protein